MSGLFSKTQKLGAGGLICTCVLMSSNVLSETTLPTQPQTWPGEGVLRDDSHRPVTSISRDLGITPDQFRRCFNDVHPAQQGTRPDPERVRANKSVLLACIQAGNPSIMQHKNLTEAGSLSLFLGNGQIQIPTLHELVHDISV